MTHEIRHPRVVFEYCVGCKWGLRAAWMMQELMQTFEKELGEVALQPNKDGGVFRVWVVTADGPTLLWDRKTEGRFPESKEIKQKLRDVIVPEKNLGHSDVKPTPPAES
uniref:Selenoprotein W n=1 Tax=Eutreptiella gymnastica TaxID=73025 RepID=A0A7S1I1B6_9EUGL